MTKEVHRLLFIVLLLFVSFQVSAQKYLSKLITVEARQETVSAVLREVAMQGQFYFSYKSNLFKNDSLVTLTVRNETVENFLYTLFGNRFQYKERGGHVIIQPSAGSDKKYVSGILIDALSGERIGYASVYEAHQLVSAMSNEDGYFRLQLKESNRETTINIRKLSYKDTVVSLSEMHGNPLHIRLYPNHYTLDSVVINQQSTVEESWLGRLVLSSRLRMNSLNLGGFLASRPYQFSLVPGLGSHGRMGAQINNKFSFNIIGGYTAGVKGFELGGLFNIVKNDMGYVQVGGLFNIVNGQGNGIQIGGIFNKVSGGFVGIQLSGMNGITSLQMKGVQLSGLISNARSLKGVQIGGLINNSSREVRGVQIAGIFNRTEKLNGVQLALLNFVDSSEGYSIGLLNFIKNGYKRFSISTNENQHINVAFKTGTDRLYSIIHAGMDLELAAKAYSFGYGLGHQINISNIWSVNPELVHQAYYLGNWAMLNSVVRLQLNGRLKLSPALALTAGPSFSLQYDNYQNEANGYKKTLGENYPAIKFSHKVGGWIGWSIGLELF